MYVPQLPLFSSQRVCYVLLIMSQQERYRLINAFFHTLAQDDERQSKRPLYQYPTYGDAHSVWSRSAYTKDELAETDIRGPELCHFYSFWSKFESSKAFEWVIKYDPKDFVEFDHPRVERCACLVLSTFRWSN